MRGSAAGSLVLTGETVPILSTTGRTGYLIPFYSGQQEYLLEAAMLQITLTQKGHSKPVTAMTAEELYESGRYAWVLGAKADKERYALIVFNNTVLQAIEIDSLEDVIVTSGKGDEQARRAIHGTVLKAGHAVYDALVGKQAPMPSTQNPIKYIDHALDLTECKCGCGQPVRADFLPGHDQRAIHDRISKIGTVADFINWFDKTFDG